MTNAKHKEVKTIKKVKAKSDRVRSNGMFAANKDV